MSESEKETIESAHKIVERLYAQAHRAFTEVNHDYYANKKRGTKPPPGLWAQRESARKRRNNLQEALWSLDRLLQESDR